MAETRTVKRSMQIQNLTLPCALRGVTGGAFDAHSDGADTDAESLCQKSDVAICVPPASLFKGVAEGFGGKLLRLNEQEQNACSA